MAVRRLHPEQPPLFAFTPENLTWAKKTMAKYPPGREASAVIPVLWRAQEQNGGWVSEPALRAVADLLGMPYIRAYEIATFYTMFQLAPVGRKAHLQVCGTTPCMLRGAEDLIEICKRRIAERPHERSADGAFSWEEVECLGVCANAPVVQIGQDTYEDLTPETMRRLLDGLVRGRAVRPGSLIGRQASCPEGGQTTLKDPALFDGSSIGAWKKRFAQPKEMLSTAPEPSPSPAQQVPVPAQATAQEVSPDEKPALLPAPSGGKADDLKLIHGIDARIEAVLHELGIFHYHQIAAWDDTHLRWLDQHLVAFEGSAEHAGWIGQARRLAEERSPRENGAKE